MKTLGTTLQGDKIHIDGYPDCVAFKLIDSNDTRQLRDMTLHQVDLRFCLSVLNELVQINLRHESIVASGLWMAAIASFYKCFGSSKARARLFAEDILSGQTYHLSVYEYFKKLRDKHFVHDENAYTQVVAGVAINDEHCANKIGDVITSVVVKSTVDDGHVIPFADMVRFVLESVDMVVDGLHHKIAADCERMSRVELLALPDAAFVAAGGDDVGTNRTRG